MSSPSAELTPDLLAAPAPHSVRVIAAERLRALNSAFDQFTAGDADGLHDVRVALRRLRSWMRAYRPEIDDTVKKKTRRGFSDLADATNGARDAEVALAWIAEQTDLTARERIGCRYIVERLERETEDGKTGVEKALADELPKLAKALSRQLDTYLLRQSVSDTEPADDMMATTRRILEEHAEAFARALGRIDSIGDLDQVHRARIAAKRLRYLLEAIDDGSANAVVERLAKLQDTLGVVRDSHRIAGRLVREIGECAARDARQAALRALDLGDDDSDEMPPFVRIRPGLVGLAERAHRRELDAFAGFRRGWRKRDVQSVRAQVQLVGESLGRGAS